MAMKKTLAFFLLATGLSLAAAQEKAKPLAQFEVIPGDLSIRSYSHKIDAGSKRIDCFSYVTDGLERHGQHEVVLTLPRRGLGNDVPPDVVEIFKAIRGRVEAGGRVNAYDGLALDPGTTFLGRKGNWGLLFIPAEVFERVDIPFEALAAVLVKGDEVELLKKRLSYRIASMLGAEYRYYPCPPWSDPDRKPVVSVKDYEKSVMAAADWRFAPGLSVRMSGTDAGGREIFLAVEMSGLPAINSILAHPSDPHTVALNLLTLPDPEATMRLAWLPGSKKSAVITAVPGPYLTGGFLLLVSQEGIDEGAAQAEDGFVLSLNPVSWNRLVSSMALAVPMEFPLGRSGRSLRIGFLRRFPFDEFVAAPYHVAGVVDFQAYMVRRARIPDVGSVEDYIKALNKAALSALKDSKSYDAHGVLIAVGVKPGKKVRAWCEAVEGSLPEGLLRDLEAALADVPTVEVKDAPIAFAIQGVLWNRKVKEFPGCPTAWSKAINESGKILDIPDGLFALIWPD